ncbi:hypothetical protein ACR2VD_27675 [Klebsiella pneumoniae]
MKVRNNTKGYISFSARMNPGATRKGYDAHGNEIRREALPEIKTVTIPPLATVEVDDAIWKAAVKAKARRQKIEMSKEPVQLGTEHGSKEAAHHILTPMGDGVFKEFNPLMDRVKSGDLTIVEKVEVQLTLEQMRAAIEKAQGYPMPKEVAEELVIAQYNRVCE